MPKLAFDANATGVHLHDVLDDRQAQAGATGVVGARLVNPVKALEQSGVMLRTDAGAKIADETLNHSV